MPRWYVSRADICNLARETSYLALKLSSMPTVDPAVIEAFKKVKKDTSQDWNTLSIKLDASGEVRLLFSPAFSLASLTPRNAECRHRRAISEPAPRATCRRATRGCPSISRHFFQVRASRLPVVFGRNNLSMYPKPDGRVQYPLCLVYYCPETCADRNRMMYTMFVNVISKALDITTGLCGLQPHARCVS